MEWRILEEPWEGNAVAFFLVEYDKQTGMLRRPEAGRGLSALSSEYLKGKIQGMLSAFDKPHLYYEPARLSERSVVKEE